MNYVCDIWVYTMVVDGAKRSMLSCAECQDPARGLLSSAIVRA